MSEAKSMKQKVRQILSVQDAAVADKCGTRGEQMKTKQAEVATQYVCLSKGLLERVCAEFRKVPEVKRYLAKHPDVNVQYFTSFVVRDEEGNVIIAWEEADSSEQDASRGGELRQGEKQ